MCRPSTGGRVCAPKVAEPSPKVGRPPWGPAYPPLLGVVRQRARVACPGVALFYPAVFWLVGSLDAGACGCG